MNSPHEPQFAWFLWSALLVVIWGIIYLLLKNKESRKEMLIVSLLTALTGLAEPLFVPVYWNPPSLFDLAHRTGFDIESIIFSFGTGGLAVIIYEWIFRSTHSPVAVAERHQSRHRWHIVALLSTPVIFLMLFFTAPWNVMYSVIVSMTAGGLLTWYCRPDLKIKMLSSAGIFLVIYFFYFLILIAMAPGYVERVWNLSALSGILIWGVPLEELLFAASFGFLWSSIYEHITWRKLK